MNRIFISQINYKFLKNLQILNRFFKICQLIIFLKLELEIKN